MVKSTNPNFRLIKNVMWNHRIRTTLIRTIKNKSFQQWPMIEMEHIRIEFTTMIIITIEINLRYTTVT